MNCARQLVSIAVLLATCGCHQRPTAAGYYNESVRALRNGNAPQSLNLARLAAKACGPAAECRWSARLLEAEVLLSDDQFDAAAAVLAESPPQNAQFAALEARRKWLLGDLAFSRGKFEECEELLAQAAALAATSGAWQVDAETRLSRARLLFVYHHDSAQADATFRQVVAQAASRGDAYYEAGALNGLGMMRLKDWRFDEAIPWFQRAAETARRGGVQRLIVATGQNLAICYSQLGSFDEAVQSRQQAIDLLGENGLLPYRLNLRWEMGNTYQQRGDSAKALELYKQALPLANTNPDKARVQRAMAASYVSLQNWDAAEQSNSQATSYSDDEDARPWAEKNQAAIAAGRGRYEEARKLYLKTIEDSGSAPLVLWESHAGLAILESAAHHYAEANREFERAIDIIDNNVDKVASPNYRLTYFALLVEFFQHFVQSLVEQGDFQRALEVADSSRARTLLQRLAQRARPAKTTVRDYMNIARASDSVLLFYSVGRPQSYLWVITPTRIYPPFRLPPTEQIRQWVDQYRGFIEKQLGDPMAHESAAGRSLYEALISPAVPLITRNSRVVLLADDALNWLNFETLPVYGAAGQTPHYWIEDVRVVAAPSLSVLKAGPAKSPPASDSLLIIGDPAAHDPEFPKLAYAAKEVETSESKFPSAKTLTGAMARPEAYREAGPGQYSLMHFSAHAVANKESPLDSAIILSGDRDNFKLYARNIIDTPLNANLVTISACRSAGARSYSGEGLVGFVWAFLQAGARNVIAGLWDVTDSSTPGLMDVLYTKIASGMNPADACREAKLTMVHSPLSYHRPYYWGPFQLYTRDVQGLKDVAHNRK